MTGTSPDRGRQVLPIPPAPPHDPTSTDIRGQDPRFVTDSPVRPPARAPNVLLILVDDMGFGASSAFGGPCEMPAADELAAGGLRFTRFHTTAVCSATRAALLTGRNHHAVGFGHVVDLSTAAPGYNGRRPASAATIAETLRANGYATGAFGKMHLTPLHEVTPVGPFDRWPTSDGFEKFYGFVAAEANQWHPPLYDGTTPVAQPREPEDGYHFSEDIVDQAAAWIRDVQMVTPDRPFFCHVAFGATHSPFHVAPAWVEKYRGRFDHGWDVQRERTLELQRRLGVVPRDAELAPWPFTVPHWDELSDDERRAACLLMELYAGFAEHMDAQVGRLIAGLQESGALDDTLVFYVLGDNGASAEGGIYGTVNEYIGWNGIADSAANILAHAEELGSPRTWPHYPAGWAVAMDTPYQWMKQVASHYGGTRNGLIVHWPNGLSDRNALRHQWHHVIDVAPTILEAAGLPEPSIVNGVPQTPIQCTSMYYAFANAQAPDRHRTQYFEMAGSRGIYRDGWVACTPHRTAPWDLQAPTPSLREDVWELYDTTSDWTQARDLAADHPEKLEELRELFLIEAARNQVLPLDDRALAARRAETTDDRGGSRASMVFHADTRRLPQDVVPAVLNSSHTLRARIDVPESGAAGVICAQGGSHSGWALYCVGGVLTYCHSVGIAPLGFVRDPAPLAPGPHEVEYGFAYDGGGLGKGGTGTLSVDGREVARARIERTVAFVVTMGEGFNVGVDLYTPVCDEYSIADSAFTGSIDWVRIDVGEGVNATFDERERIELAIQ